jgi:ankyrin repeat protein
MIAAVKGYKELVRALLSHGADANLADIYGWTPLMRAVAENRLGVVHILLASKSVNVNARNDSGATALHEAAEKGYFEIAQLLITNNADVQSTDRKGRTPLIIAGASGHNDIVDLINRAVAERQGSKRPR